AMKGDRERCLEAGMDAYVPKPIRVDELFRAIDAAVADRPPAAGPNDRAARAPRPGAGGREPGAAAGLSREGRRQRVGGNKKLLERMAGAFAEECPRLLAEIRAAVSAGDAPRLRRAAHTLKGAVGTFGAREAFEAALRLETMGREGNLGGAEEVRAA